MGTITRFKPFKAYLHSRGVVKCTPVIYNDLSGCGTGIMYEDNSGATSIIYPRNLIAAWRGTEFIRHFKTIKHETLYVVYYAGMRNIKNETHLRRILSVVGWKKYEEIMSISVPQIVIDMITKKEAEEPPLLYPLEEEIRAGTIRNEQAYCSPVN